MASHHTDRICYVDIDNVDINNIYASLLITNLRQGLGDEITKAGLPVKRIRTRTVGGFELLNLDVPDIISKEPSLVYKGEPMCFTIMRYY